MTKASVALSNLRAVVIVIVVAFHSSLAYLASAPAPISAFAQAPYRWEPFPIVDVHRWLGFDVFCAWQDVSLMSLLFLLSGLFAANSLRRKGSRTYVSGRLWRIGLPFLLAVIFLSPLSYYPAYLVRTADPSLVEFWRQWISLPSWPSGPQWFLWQLLAVNLLGAGLYLVWPGFIERLSRLGSWAGGRPLKSFALFEPTAALDGTNGQAILRILASIANDSGRSVLVVTHDSRLTPFANRIIFIEDGRLIREQIGNAAPKLLTAAVSGH